MWKTFPQEVKVWISCFTLQMCLWEFMYNKADKHCYTFSETTLIIHTCSTGDEAHPLEITKTSLVSVGGR